MHRPRVQVPHVVAAHPEQGRSPRCDGTIAFDDTGALLTDGRAVAPHPVPADHLTVVARPDAARRTPGAGATPLPEPPCPVREMTRRDADAPGKGTDRHDLR
ncbi:DUF5999 family protein [Streptomyces sp. AVP053U2]|uniref:DUF5999 family protein n=1 Tax=Streptomyces sp. AVP053U2 TaxID=1737066 RepID=UPI00099FC49A